MDYEINLGTLISKASELGELKTSAEDIYNEFNSCYLNQLASTEIILITANLRQSVKRLKEGVTNSNTWYTNYTKELSELEESLAAFSASGLTPPTEFKSEFVDMFGKVTMPIIKTGGDIHANASPINRISNMTIKEALEKYGDEYDNAYKKYASDKTFMTITKLEDGSYITHIVVADPDQIHKGYANGAYGNGLETTSSAAARYGWIVGVNGSHFRYSNGKQDVNRADVPTNLVAINDGKLADNSGSRAGGLEICLTKDGRFFTAKKGASAQDLINQGVVQTFSSHETNILENGVVQTTYPSAMSRQYNRTVIGMVQPGEYYIYTGNSSATKAASTLQKRGCTWAKSLDQGGSVSLATKDESVKKSGYGGNYEQNGERQVGDFLYFADV